MISYSFICQIRISKKQFLLPYCNHDLQRFFWYEHYIDFLQRVKLPIPSEYLRSEFLHLLLMLSLLEHIRLCQSKIKQIIDICNQIVTCLKKLYNPQCHISHSRTKTKGLDLISSNLLCCGLGVVRKLRKHLGVLSWSVKCLFY